MSISTYSDLQTSVANWLHRSDLNALIPDFIALAESKLSGDLQARSMEVRTTLTTTAGNAYVTLPTDMLEMHRLTVKSDPVYVLSYRSPDELQQDYPYTTTGKPAVFAILGSEMQLAPIPDSAYTLELVYKQKIPALSNSNTSNWLLAQWPNAYLYGALCAAQPYIANDQRLPTFQALYQEAVDGINGIDWYSGTTMKVRTK